MSYLIDSNIFIYAGNALSDNEQSYKFLAGLSTFFYSSITKIEVMGFHKFDKEDKDIVEKMFMCGSEIQLSQEIIKRSIELKQERKMSLGDSIIAASSLVNALILVTRNINDFNHINNLQLFNPYD